MTSFRLHLLRHGEPELTGRMLGRTDSPATARGIAACVGQAAGLSVTRRIASDLSRARACAEAIGPAEVDPRWRELDFGEWDGLAASNIDPEAMRRFWDDPDAAPPPGGERWSDLVVRVRAAIADLPSEPTLVVTHGGAIRAALHVLCGFDLRACWSFALPYAALVTLEVWDGAPRSAQVTGLVCP
ncbi:MULTISPECIES: histidine phosphatase family protein [Sphingomonas]|uniref:Histidine phosphatase family protein n=1 Tax=Sphingomonas zeae TaxID=1646122 RepID=A0A7Y6B6G5_9SPHN|nr:MULTISPECIES: histidine phosphatase family protein [Sphingomonas]MBB4047164.1 alpha-ribazole phosphatase [Sphingomonas zeae]MDK8186373.1 histidine phosphatase family protein [Sphingomonas zeae]MDK8216006.1 histidine phosphatase family protein [Sphingomonas sp. UMB7805-LC452B]NUU48312.1 histidine phosphatase family protein [Sphingomonas zeae]